MKKNIVIICAIVIFVLAGTIIFTVIKKGDFLNRNKDVNKDNFVYEGIFDEELIEEDSYTFTSYEDYKSDFSNGKLTSNDFKNNNYVLLKIMYDSCSESNIEPADYKIDGNTIKVVFAYDASCGLCASQYMYYLLKVDKSITDPSVKIDFKARNKTDCDPNITYKPMIYLYPERMTKVSVKLGYENKLTTTYPKYNNGWVVTANPNGDLYDENGNYYYGLYWEGLNKLNFSFEDGFVVSNDNLIEFLEEKLTVLGLNDKERNEFIVYWLPILEQNKYNLIRFESMDAINSEMPLEVSPTPDTVIRVLMEYKPLDEKVDIVPQKLTSPVRNGFTVVEWGGTLIK